MSPDNSIHLRPWEETDLHSLVKYASNPAVAANMTDLFPHPYTEAHGYAFIRMARSQEPRHILCIEVNGEAAGSIGLHRQSDIHRMNMELGYWLAEPFWGKGIVTEAVRQMVVYGFAHWDVQRIFARPFGTNIASQRVLEKAGFRLEARFEKTLLKNGVYLDELVYAVRRDSAG